MVKVVGKKYGAFEDAATGREVEYAKLFVLCEPPEDDNVYEGQVPDMYKISKELLENVPIGANVVLDVNSSGKINRVIIVDDD